jgi:hypothetical protein
VIDPELLPVVDLEKRVSLIEQAGPTDMVSKSYLFELKMQLQDTLLSMHG